MASTASPPVTQGPPPCEARDRLAGGLAARLVVAAVDRLACRYGATAEELVLALISDERASAFRREHGADPRAALAPLLRLLGDPRLLARLDRLDPG